MNGEGRDRAWSLRDPSGQAHQFRNLARFISEHHASFSPEDLEPFSASNPALTNAYVHLSHLRPGHKQHVGIWKGWSWLGNETAIPDRRTRQWALQGPDGTIFEFTNLTKFIEAHRHAFDPADLETTNSRHSSAYTNLARLRPGRKRHRSSWKSWSWVGVESTVVRHPPRQGLLVSPDGQTFEITKLGTFVAEHADLFDPADLVPFPSNHKFNGAQSNLSHLRRGRLKSWKGWKWSTG